MRNPLRLCNVLLVVVGLPLVLSLPNAASAQSSVLEEILTIMKDKGLITEEQKRALAERAMRELATPGAARAPQDASPPVPAPPPTAGQPPAIVAQPTPPPTPETSAPADRAFRLMAGIEDGKPFLRSADEMFRIELGGQAQLDYAAVEDGATALSGGDLDDQFLVRRARFELSGTFFEWIRAKVEADFAEDVSLKDAYLDFRFLRELALRAGQFKVPFSREELTSSRFIDFVERSIANELAPGRDVGAVLHGRLLDRMVEYSIGAFNGAGDNTAETNGEKLLAGRFTVAPFQWTSNSFFKGLEFGANFTWGDEDVSASAQGRTTARTSNRFRFFAAHPTQGERTRWGVDMAWPVGPASAQFEYMRRIDQRKNRGIGNADLDDLTATGWSAAATFLLTGENKVPNATVVPKRPFSPIPGKIGPGAWELALRYADLSFDSASPLDFFDGSVTNGITGGGVTAENGAKALTAGLNWYLNSRTRAMFNWTHYWFDNPLGTPLSCSLPTCGAADLQRRGETSWEIQTRLQLWF